MDKLINQLSIRTSNTSPLRYVGGKSKACKKLDEIFRSNFDIKKIKTIISPFVGGASFEFYLQNKYSFDIIANDKFIPLCNFWNACKTHNSELCDNLLSLIDKITKKEFSLYRDLIMKLNDDELQQAIYYFVINRCSFSGSTLSGGFSQESSKKRFTISSIDRIRKLDLTNFEIHNNDFTKFIDSHKDDFMFLDPPYYLETSSKLYGFNGDMHEDFNHDELYSILQHRTNWMMTYNNCEYIRDLYKNFIIIDVDWNYGMNKSKKSSEIVILCKSD